MDLDIESIFSHHPPKNDTVSGGHQMIRDLMKSDAYAFMVLLPDSPERTLAIRKLQQAMMYANSAIAQYGVKEYEEDN